MQTDISEQTTYTSSLTRIKQKKKKIIRFLGKHLSLLWTLHLVLICFVYLSPTVALSFFYYIIRSVGVSAVTLLVYLINVPDLHVVSIAKLYVIKNEWEMLPLPHS